MAPGTGIHEEKISPRTELLTQLVEAKFFSRLDRLIRIFRSPLAWKAQGWTPSICLLGRFQSISPHRYYKPCKNWSNCLGQSCPWVSGMTSAFAYWSYKSGKVSMKLNEISVEILKKWIRKRKEKIFYLLEMLTLKSEFKGLSLIHVVSVSSQQDFYNLCEMTSQPLPRQKDNTESLIIYKLPL